MDTGATKSISVLIKHHSWANQTIFAACENVKDHDGLIDFGIGYRSVYKTLLHLAGAMMRWCDRIEKRTLRPMPEKLERQWTFPEIRTLFHEANNDFDEIAEKCMLQSATSKGLGMIASTPKGEPVVPSMILSIVKVDDSSYAQLSSTESQGAVAAAKDLTLNQTDAAKEITNETGTVTIKKAGFYFVVAAGQAGSANGDGKGNLRLWLRQNGKDVDNSNTEQTINGKYTAVLICQGVGEMKAGDKLKLTQSASGIGVGMIASSPKGEPVVPSMIFSIIKVD